MDCGHTAARVRSPSSTNNRYKITVNRCSWSMVCNTLTSGRLTCEIVSDTNLASSSKKENEMAHIGPTTISQLRSKYQSTWGHNWPHPDKFLIELSIESKNDLGFSAKCKLRNSKFRKTKDEFLKLTMEEMRVNDNTPVFNITQKGE